MMSTHRRATFSAACLNRRLASCVLLAGLHGLTACFGGDASAEQLAVTPVAEDQMTPVVAVAHTADVLPVLGSDGKFHLVYELRLMNSRAAPATLLRVDAVDAVNTSRVVGSLQSAALLASLRTLDNHAAASARIETNAGRLLLMHLVFDSRADVPNALTHSVRALGGTLNNADPTPVDQTYRAAPLAVGTRVVPTLGPPLRGTHWIAVNGCCSPSSVHRNAGLPVNGDIHYAQRYAIDFMRLTPQGRLLSGSPTVPANYAAYGNEVLAAADGTVVSTLNNLDDQNPPLLPDPATMTLATADGNHVLIDIGNGNYLFYAHMQKGSVRPKVGDKVKRGDVVGLLGNSGNSSAPHLHVHVVDGRSVLGSNGVPYVFDNWLQSGQGTDAMAAGAIEDANFSAALYPRPQARAASLPLDLAIVDFP